jgi:hypothetical protein
MRLLAPVRPADHPAVRTCRQIALLCAVVLLSTVRRAGQQGRHGVLEDLHACEGARARVASQTRDGRVEAQVLFLGHVVGLPAAESRAPRARRPAR